MRFFIAATSLLAGLSFATDTKPHCKTVTSTASVCTTCRQLACLALETVTLFPDCPSPVPTTTTAYPCSESKCPDGCMSTSYTFVTPTPTPYCGTVTSTQKVCSTCVTLECAATEYVTVGNGCPDPPATKVTAYECGGCCPAGCGTTSYITVARPTAG